jgi:hypothetical protein
MIDRGDRVTGATVAAALQCSESYGRKLIALARRPPEPPERSGAHLKVVP